MLNSLISASIQNQDLTYLEKLPHLVLLPKEIELINWLTEYRVNHGSIPTKERFEESDYSDYWTNHMITTPLSDLFNMTVVDKSDKYAIKNFRSIQNFVDENPGKIPTQQIIDLGFQLSSLNQDSTIFLSDYDREDLYSDIEPNCVKFGFDIIDDSTGGLHAGELGIIGGRPESGKTLLTNFISWNVVTDYGKYENCKRVLYVSAEMTPAKIIARMDSIAGKFNSKIIRNKKDKELLKESKAKANKAWEIVHLAGGEFIIPKLGIISPNTVLDLINTHKPDFVVCDAMYRFKNPGGAKDWRGDVEIVQSIANIARITNTPILGTSQLTRNSTKGDYGLEDLSFTDAFAQESDIVLAVYNMPSHPNSIMINTLKSRDGTKNGTVEFKVSFNNMSYKEMNYVDMEEAV